MTNEEIKNFHSIFSEYRELNKEHIADLYSAYEGGNITKEELNSEIGELGISSFISAQKEFKAIYNFRPLKVPIYCLAAYETPEKEKEAA